VYQQAKLRTRAAGLKALPQDALQAGKQGAGHACPADYLKSTGRLRRHLGALGHILAAPALVHASRLRFTRAHAGSHNHGHGQLAVADLAGSRRAGAGAPGQQAAHMHMSMHTPPSVVPQLQRRLPRLSRLSTTQTTHPATHSRTCTGAGAGLLSGPTGRMERPYASFSSAAMPAGGCE